MFGSFKKFLEPLKPKSYEDMVKNTFSEKNYEASKKRIIEEKAKKSTETKVSQKEKWEKKLEEVDA